MRKPEAIGYREIFTQYLPSSLLGGVAGYWILPSLAPYSLSHKIAWLLSPPALALIGVLSGAIIGSRPILVKIMVPVGAIAGAILGRQVGPFFSVIVGYLWYEALSFKYPWDTFVFFDSVLILTWLLLGGGGALVGWWIARKLLWISTPGVE